MTNDGPAEVRLELELLLLLDDHMLFIIFIVIVNSIKKVYLNSLT